MDVSPTIVGEAYKSQSGDSGVGEWVAFLLQDDNDRPRMQPRKNIVKCITSSMNTIVMDHNYIASCGS